jgi:membrane protein
MDRHKITAGAKKQTWAVWDLLTETYRAWSQDNAPAWGAALAFYTTFSLAPLLIVLIAVVGFIFGQAQVQAEILHRLQELMGPQGARAVRIMLHAAFRPGSGLTATIIGVVVLLYGATRTFVMLRQTLNLMWGVQPNPKVSIKGYLTGQLLSFALVLGIGFLLVLSLLASAGLAAVSRFMGDVLPLPVFFFQVINFICSTALITLLVAFVFKVLPEVEIAWSDVWIGSLSTALLFTLGNFILGWYLAKSSISSAYGAASSLAVLLFWVYYSAQILFLGAEFTQVYANKYGSKVQPRANRPEPGSEAPGTRP